LRAKSIEDSAEAQQDNRKRQEEQGGKKPRQSRTTCRTPEHQTFFHPMTEIYWSESERVSKMAVSARKKLKQKN